jgi:hypothetical protein
LEKIAEKAAAAEKITALLTENRITAKTPEEIVEALKRDLETTRAGRVAGHKWPPIINLSEAGGFFFEVGSAQLTPEFANGLKDKVVPRLLEIAREYPDVDLIEVVGHTDEQRIKRRPSNLDEELVSALRGGSVAALQPGDNAGLGLARAVSVVTKLLKDERLTPFVRVLPLSGAQLIKNDESLAVGDQGDVRERRRIEIRVRKHEPSTSSQGDPMAELPKTPVDVPRPKPAVRQSQSRVLPIAAKPDDVSTEVGGALKLTRPKPPAVTHTSSDASVSTSGTGTSDAERRNGHNAESAR